VNLFGDAAGPHIAHFHARHENGRVELDWEVRNTDPIRWRVLRSTEGFADSAQPMGTNVQVLVNESADTFLADEGLDEHTHYFYTVFSLEADGTWQRQVEAKVRPHDALSWFHPQAQEILDAEASEVRLPAYRPPLARVRLPGDAARQSAAYGWLRMGAD
jgi:hypothetical protein